MIDITININYRKTLELYGNVHKTVFEACLNFLEYTKEFIRLKHYGEGRFCEDTHVTVQ